MLGMQNVVRKALCWYQETRFYTNEITDLSHDFAQFLIDEIIIWWVWIVCLGNWLNGHEKGLFFGLLLKNHKVFSVHQVRPSQIAFGLWRRQVQITSPKSWWNEWICSFLSSCCKHHCVCCLLLETSSCTMVAGGSDRFKWPEVVQSHQWKSIRFFVCLF